MKVKVCGITSFEDAASALDLGADVLGFNFYPRSPRFIRPAAARGIIRRLPPILATVGVFVNVPHHSQVAEQAGEAGVQALQLHGDESPDYCRALESWPLIKAVRIGRTFDVSLLPDYPVRALLLDSRDDLLFGGTGKPFDWSLVGMVKSSLPVILAGGLTPENVAAAIQAVQPYAVDVCSGVESSPGKKDSAKLAQFIDEVRRAGS